LKVTGTVVASMDQIALPRIRPRVLRQEALDAIRSAILSKEIPPGARLREADMATRMGISRAPVREALRQLEQEGLVEFFPHRGAVVVGVPEAEIDAIYELRALIEQKAIERACPLITDEQLGRLAALIDAMQSALDASDIEALAERDLEFHGVIVEVAGFSLLRHIWEGLDGLVRVRSYQALDRPGQPSRYFRKNAATSHQAILRALKSRNVEDAVGAIREHIMEVPGRMKEPGKGRP
jgi:DNA-binding GntR family transcriptional regulator